jgi:hypothetical protein
LSEKQIPQVVENLESGGKPKEAFETAALRPRQVRYPRSGTHAYEVFLTGLRWWQFQGEWSASQ